MKRKIKQITKTLNLIKSLNSTVEEHVNNMKNLQQTTEHLIIKNKKNETRNQSRQNNTNSNP